MVSIVDAHIGSRVKRTRELRNVALCELAAALETPVWQLELFERGAARMPATVLVACGLFLKVRPSFFLEGRIGRERRACDRGVTLARRNICVLAFVTAFRRPQISRGRQ